MSQIYNENSRVKIPAVLHLMRLGYDYLSLKNENWDKQTNIFPDIFVKSLCRINPDLSPDDARRLLADIHLELDNEDLGQKFYERLTNQSGGKKLIDFQNFNNNSFHVVTVSARTLCHHFAIILSVKHDKKNAKYGNNTIIQNPPLRRV